MILFQLDVTRYEADPLADATYIRANFSYIPRTVKELSIKTGDIFHIHDEVNCPLLRAFMHYVVYKQVT